jgi:hypothetical protein
MKRANPIFKKSGVYALIDPESQLVRYVGRSINISNRFNNHKTSKTNLPVSKWCRKLKSKSLSPEIMVLEYHEKPEEIEAKWIAHYRDIGQADLNLHDGTNTIPFNGGGRCDEVWSVKGLTPPFSLMIRTLWKYQKNLGAKKVTSHWKSEWERASSEIDRIHVQSMCYQVVQNLGTDDLKILAEKWAIKAVEQINEKYPNRFTLVYNDGVEVTP